MGKRKISVEEFTSDVLAGLSDNELMKKYRISRRTLDGMMAKLLQRGELKPSDLADPAQKSLEPTLELAMTCPQCGALNLFGSAQCPECGQSRVTRHFQAMDNQEAKPVPSDSHADIEQPKPEPKPDKEPQRFEDRIVLDKEKDQEPDKDRKEGESPGKGEDLWGADQLPPPKKSKPALPRQKPRSRKRFPYIAAAALLLIASVVGVGLYTDMISLPFGSSTPPPTAVHKPAPRPKPVKPPLNKVAEHKPSPVAQPQKPAPAEPAKEPPSVPAPQKAPTPAVAETKPEPPVAPPKPRPEETATAPIERAKPEPPVTEPEKPAPVELAREVPPEKTKEPEFKPEPAAAQEPAPKMVEPEPVRKPEKPSEKETPRLAVVPPDKEPPAAKPGAREPAPKPVTRVQPVDAAPTFGESSGHMPSYERPGTRLPGPPAQRHAALKPVTPAPQEPAASEKRNMEQLLIDALKNSDANMTTVLLDGGANPDSADSEGATALMYAARSRCLSCVNTLLKRGADVRLTDSRGRTALDLARRSGHTRAAELILAHDPEKGPAALLIACREGLTDIVRVLVDNGVDVNATDKDGNTALMAASEKGNLDMVSILLKKGADVRAQNNRGQTALSRAGSAGRRVSSRVRRELVRMLGERSTLEDGTPQQNR